MAKSQPRRVRAKQGESLRDWIKTLVLVLAVVITFRGVVAQAYQIPTGSMERTLLIGDYLYINKMLYGSEIDIGFHGHRFFYHRFPAFRQPRPGDVIVFRYPPNPQQDFIKRCVAVGGQTVEVRDKVLFVDGKPKNEPYAVHDDSRVFPREISARDNWATTATTAWTAASGVPFPRGWSRGRRCSPTSRGIRARTWCASAGCSAPSSRARTALIGPPARLARFTPSMPQFCHTSGRL